MRLIIRWLINAMALVAIAYYVPGIYVYGFYAAMVTALMLGLVNAVVRPIILLLTLPVNVLTLGLFTLVVNAWMFWFVATLVKGFEVAGFWPAFWGALIMTVISWITSSLLSDDSK